MILIFKNSNKLHFRGIHTTVTKILVIITSAKGKEMHITWEGKGLVLSTRNQLVPHEGDWPGRECREREEIVSIL